MKTAKFNLLVTMISGLLFSGCSSDNSTTNISHNGVKYLEVTSPFTQKTWLDRNLGASQVCTLKDDTECYGDYYQWGRATDGHQKNDANITTTIATTVTEVGAEYIFTISFPYDWTTDDSDGILRARDWNNLYGDSVCPSGFRVPTIDELKAELTDQNISDSTGPFKSFLKLPSAGYRSEFTGTIEYRGTDGIIWSTSNTNYNAFGVEYDENILIIDNSNFARGCSIRCIKN